MFDTLVLAKQLQDDTTAVYKKKKKKKDKGLIALTDTKKFN